MNLTPDELRTVLEIYRRNAVRSAKRVTNKYQGLIKEPSQLTRDRHKPSAIDDIDTLLAIIGVPSKADKVWSDYSI